MGEVVGILIALVLGFFVSQQMDGCQHRHDNKQDMQMNACKIACYPHPVTSCTEERAICSPDTIKELK